MDWLIACINAAFLFSWSKVGRVGDMLCCVVIAIDSTISSFAKCDGVRISCCVRFLVPLNFLD